MIDAARKHGFDTVGVTRPDAAPQAKARLEQFLADGAHGDMDWMETTAQRRGDPRALWADVRSIVMLGVNYGPQHDPLAILERREHGAISVYAQREDYHEIIKKRLKALARWLIAQAGGDVKVFVDTAAVMEKPLAAGAGLGWQGKHTNLVSRDYRLLAVSRLDLHHTGTSLRRGRHRPLRHLPLVPRRLSRPRRFLLPIGSMRGAASPTSPSSTKARSTAELRPLMGNRIYGCDDCLAVCPWNKFAQEGHDAKLAMRGDLREPKLAELSRLDDATFRALFAKTAVKRAGRDRFVRNVLIAIGNSGDASLASDAEARLGDQSPLVRGAAVWALGRLDRARLDALAQRRGSESDLVVQEEWAAALA